MILLPVTLFAILDHQLSELFVHLSVEVISQEKRPEAEKGVHLLRLPDSKPLPFCDRLRKQYQNLTIQYRLTYS